jgi:hypothetical protein
VVKTALVSIALLVLAGAVLGHHMGGHAAAGEGHVESAALDPHHGATAGTPTETTSVTVVCLAMLVALVSVSTPPASRTSWCGRVERSTAVRASSHRRSAVSTPVALRVVLQV